MERSPEVMHRIMSGVHQQDTKPEVRLRKALWHMGLRYRKNFAALPGKPDIALTGRKIAIFIDGDFWHARGNQNAPGSQVKSHKDFWKRKLARNVERDREVNDELTEMGWLVLRFWESDINQNLSCVINEIKRYL